ncbi:MAG: pyridoxamine 5'-phosphate oxidase [Flavobacteriales bacterium]|nr:Pyridoxine/pyridoxamine 5'-phosphate oxidase [Flavobacteriales bacterium]MCC6578769.1 pyridoxamine 5'-phosphate oxidase [Flavobacteriales bacterium]NUQ13766.1 pyridoxamine 5'-phosphate oxidase [Flavobacteriales bacterium]
MDSARKVGQRTDYSKTVLLEEEAGNDPIALFGRWLHAAEEDGLPEPHAMTLATAGSFSISCRVVLLRSFDAQGFVFFTNYNSRKAMDLERDPRAALSFFWPQHERQVRIEGKVEKVEAALSDAYFKERPRESQVGAWASDQSRIADDRSHVDERYARWTERFKDAAEVPRPLHWGGMRVRPVRIEFWQGRPSRLHDRIVFEHFTDGSWSRIRLQP